MIKIIAIVDVCNPRTYSNQEAKIMKNNKNIFKLAKALCSETFHTDFVGKIEGMSTADSKERLRRYRKAAWGAHIKYLKNMTDEEFAEEWNYIIGSK